MKKSIHKKRKAGSEPIHSTSLKVLVAREYLEGKLSHGQLAEKYNLNSEATSRYFLKWYQQWEKDLDLPVPEGPLDLDLAGKSTQELEEDLFDAKLKITALEMLLNKMEEYSGVELPKKPGAKSSKK
jgi:transposase-like protein